MKPSDRWSISLCQHHHLEQHAIGEAAFEQAYEINLFELAREFTRRSPYRVKLRDAPAGEQPDATQGASARLQRSIVG